MALTVKHLKTNGVPDWTQADLDAQIALGNFAPGTTLAQITLASDWNANHVITGTADITGSINGGTGITTTGSGTTADPYIFNSTWTASGNNIYNNNLGNVGIGTTNPNQGTAGGGPAKVLQVNDATNAVFRVTAGLMDSLWQTVGGIGAGSGTYMGNISADPLFLVTAGGARQTILADGRIGMGTNAPSNRLTVAVTASADGICVDGTNNPAFSLRVNGTPQGYIGAVTGIGSYFFEGAPGDIIIRSENNNVLMGRGTNGHATLAVVNDKVGIGTSNPQAALHVLSGTAGNMGFPYEAAVIERYGDTKFGVFSSDPSGGASYVLGRTGGSAPFIGFEIQQAGNDLRFNSLVRNSGGIVTGATTNILYLTNGGNVGIGKANPAYSLDVRGAINIDDSVNYPDYSVNINPTEIFQTDGTYSTSITPASFTVSDGTRVSSLTPIGMQSPTYTVTGSTSGFINIKSTTGGYNFNLPTSAGAAGQVLASAGGGTSNMTWTSTPSVIATITGINAKTVANTTLFTPVPTGKTLIVTGVVIRCTAASGTGSGPTIGIGSAAGTSNIFAATALAALDTAGKVYGFSLVGMSVSVAAGGTVYLNLSVASTLTTETIAADLMGYYV